MRKNILTKVQIYQNYLQNVSNNDYILVIKIEKIRKDNEKSSLKNINSRFLSF
jgi:hypothetical protein